MVPWALSDPFTTDGDKQETQHLDRIAIKNFLRILKPVFISKSYEHLQRSAANLFSLSDTSTNTGYRIRL